jgi:receptor protein-tyrosine kinase
MSRYFEAALRSRQAKFPVVESRIATPADNGQHQDVLSTSVEEPPASGLEQCQTLPLPTKKLLQTQFRGSGSLGPAKEAYRALRTRLLRLQTTQNLRSVLITSAIPGEGKSHTALHLAQSCAQLNDVRIILIDGDLRTHGLSDDLGAAASPGLAEVLSGQCTPEEAVMATDIPNLYVLGAGTPTKPPAELYSGRQWKEFIDWCNKAFKLVLVDSPPVLNLADVEVMAAACDGMLMVVRALHTKREVLQECAKQIDSKKLLGLVYNATENGLQRRYYSRYYHSDSGQL